MRSNIKTETALRSQVYVYPLAALLISIFLVVSIDLLTNSVDIQKFSWDFRYYIDMAQHGISGNPNLRAPFAYRYATPWLSSIVSHTFHLSVEDGFRFIAYVGAISQLFFVFLYARYLRTRTDEAVIILFTIALSMFHIKFLLFDVYRPDHLAYSFMILAMILLMEGKLSLCVLVSLVGILFREFLVVPVLCVMFVLLTQNKALPYRNRISYIAITTLALAVVIALPRVFIHVATSTQYLDPVNNSEVFMSHLLSPLFSVKRDFNIVFNILSYFLPTLSLITVKRWSIIKNEIKKRYLFLYPYSFFVLLLTAYGGTDMNRFVTYFFIPQIILLSIIFIKGKLHWIECSTMLVLMALYNRIFLPIPMKSREAYLDWYGGYSNRVNSASLERFAELGLYIGIALVIRFILTLQESS